ncbi:MAG: 50S ribosomal protein P1 [archaeon]
MELVYAAMLLHRAGKPINEENIKKIMEAAGVKKEDAQIKALVAALEGVDIEKAIKEASVPVAVAAPSAAGKKPAEKKEEESEKDKEEEEAKATAGLGALFG